MSYIKLKLRPFRVPNFALAERPVRPRQDGPDFSESASFPLSEIDAETLDMMCDEFRVAVFLKAGKTPPARSQP